MIKQRLLKWIGDALYPIFIPRDEYDFVQNARWRSDEHARHMDTRFKECLDSLYERKYRPFEMLNDAAVTTEEIYENVVFRSLDIRYSVSIPEYRFITMIDLNKERDEIRRLVIERLAEGFKKHVAEQIFK